MAAKAKMGGGKGHLARNLRLLPRQAVVESDYHFDFDALRTNLLAAL